MAILAHQCPHPKCLTVNIGLIVVATNHVRNRFSGIVHLQCPKCSLPSAAYVIKEKQAPPSLDNIRSEDGDVLSMGFVIKHFWPEPPKPNVPELLPPDVARIYLQAERNFTMEGNEEAAGMMYRKALDIGLKKIDPSLSGMLGQKIKKLADAGKLTVDIATWSAAVRDDGNEAAHEEQPITRAQLTELRNFTEMVLRYLFSLPNAVKKRRGEKLDWEEATAATVSPAPLVSNSA